MPQHTLGKIAHQSPISFIFAVASGLWGFLTMNTELGPPSSQTMNALRCSFSPGLSENTCMTGTLWLKHSDNVRYVNYYT